jgi:co-chaperonin GroES (HSP10)
MANLINFNPTRDWVVVPDPSVKETESGILLSEGSAMAAKKPTSTVVATGPQCAQIKVGDEVLVHPTAEGFFFEIEGKKYAAINEFMVLGVLPIKPGLIGATNL